MDKPAEKRVTPRFGPIVLKARLEIGGEPFEGYLINVSRGGGFVAMDEPPDEETEVTIRTLLPFRLGAFTGEARVVWRRDAEQAPRVHSPAPDSPPPLPLPRVAAVSPSS